MKVLQNSLLVLALVLAPGLTLSQPRIEGSVFGSNGRPLAGVNVLIKGTDLFTVVDMRGHFSINLFAKYDSVDLIFRFNGYQNIDTPIILDSGKDIKYVVNVTMVKDRRLRRAKGSIEILKLPFRE